MRDVNLDLNQFSIQIEQRLKRYQEKFNGLRMQVVNSSTFTQNFSGFILKNLKLTDFQALCIASWYMPEEISYTLRFDLEDYNLKFDIDSRNINTLLLKSKAEMILFLQETKLWHTRDFFGNVLPSKIKVLEDLRFRKISTKVKEIQRKRGYHDHGTLRPKHLWLPTSDFSLTELQNQIEIKRQSQIDTTNFIGGWLS
jgi:hypothetical protein